MQEKTMKAWVLTQPKNLEYQVIPIPKITQDKVLIKIDAACLCNGSDPGIYNGHDSYQTPCVFGHEASGTIVEIGDNVTGYNLGDRVCFWFEMGAFAEYQAVTPSNIAIFLVPENLKLEETPVVELVLASCRSLMAHPATQTRKSITICGMGPSGLILLQYAKLLGYQKIYCWDLYESRRNLSLELGASAVYNPATLTKDIINSMPTSDISVMMMGDDIIPGQPTLNNLMNATKNSGTIISYGHPENGRYFSPFIFQSRNLSMVGPVNDFNIIREKGKLIMEALKNESIRIEPLITHRLKFDELKTAFEHLLTHPQDQIKVIFTW